MTLPSVNDTVLDGQLASANFIGGQTPMIVGVSSAGTANTCKSYPGNSQSAIVADWGYGPMPQQAARMSAKGVAVAVCKTAATTTGVAGSVTFTGTGTSAVTITGAPNDFYRCQMRCVLAGVVATGPLGVQFSLDNGETWGPAVQVGTATTVAVGNTGMTANLAAGNLAAGDVAAWQTTTEPKWSASDLSTALTAVANTGIPWDFVGVVGSCSATEAATIKTWLTGLESAKKFTGVFAETVRIASLGAWTASADATWQTALITDWATFNSKRIAVGAGDLRWVSAIDQSVYLRPVAWFACEMASLFDSALYELGRVKDDGHGTGALDGSLFDTLGNQIGHNETNQPGLYLPPSLAALGFITARTIPTKGRAAYITKALMMSPQGSDFVSWRLRRVMDIGEGALNAFFVNEIEETPPVNSNGTILTSYADALELQAQKVVQEQLIDPGRVSGSTISIHRNDNLLSGPTKGTVNVDVRFLPTPTTDAVNLALSFTPALPSA